MVIRITGSPKLIYLIITLGRPAVQQGMRVWQLLLDWLTPAEQNGLTSWAVALRREVQWVRAVDRKKTVEKI